MAPYGPSHLNGSQLVTHVSNMKSFHMHEFGLGDKMAESMFYLVAILLNWVLSAILSGHLGPSLHRWAQNRPKFVAAKHIKAMDHQNSMRYCSRTWNIPFVALPLETEQWQVFTLVGFGAHLLSWLPPLLFWWWLPLPLLPLSLLLFAHV